LIVIQESQPPQKSIFRNPLVYTFLLILIVGTYVGWILLSRHQANRAYEHRAEQAQAQRQRENDQAAIDQLGGSDLSIQMLYATPRIHSGETAQICYGVANAKSVTLQPQSSQVWPSHNLCVDVKPSKTTTYTLVATGTDGKSVSQQVTVEVR
jgi:type II secretory pathway pseudopilin PulG